MEYQLQLKPFERKDGFKYKILEITDFTLHTSKMRPTGKAGQQVEKAIKSNTPGRIYVNNQNGLSNGVMDFSTLNRNPDLIRFIKGQEEQGVKILLRIPVGTPILAGKDSVEFIHSVKGKRILRWLDKKKKNN